MTLETTCFFYSNFRKLWETLSFSINFYQILASPPSSPSQDNSVITGLVPAMWLYEDTGEEVPALSVSSSGGLHVRGRDRSILRVALPSDCLGFQIGARGGSGWE